MRRLNKHTIFTLFISLTLAMSYVVTASACTNGLGETPVPDCMLED